VQSSEFIAAAHEALSLGDVDIAVGHARAGVEAGEGAAAHELLGGLLLFDDDIEGARRQYELAFKEWRRAAEDKAAALTAATLADLHTSWLGNRRAGQGWAARGTRLLESQGSCIERGYVHLAVIACESPDLRGVEAAAAAALDLALKFGDSDLEVRALADSGYALVVQGRTRDGLARLDEAMAALSAGEVSKPAVAAMSFCALLAACERTGDAGRAEEWTRVVAAGVTEPLGNRPRALHMHCRLVLGSVLCTTGRWDEGEAALLDALGPGGSAIYAHRSEAAVRLAALRLLQGRLDEARALVLPYEERASACEVMARIHMASGELEQAGAVARRALEAAGPDILRAAEVLSLLVEICLAKDDTSAATGHAAALERIGHNSDSNLLQAEASLAKGRLAAAEVEPELATRLLQDGLALLTTDEHPLLRAVIALELAHVLVDTGEQADAIGQAQRALTTFDRLGATPLGDRARALLRSVGVSSRRATASTATQVSMLSNREQQVLGLLRQGLTNAEIGKRLYISAKTAEHHVSRVLSKLGVRSRAEAAAIAAVTQRPVPVRTE
jgi:DNA-binding NarL/FixJ family response regulator